MTIKISHGTADALSLACDLTVICVAEGASVKSGPLAQLAKSLGAVVSKNLKRDEFTGKKDQTLEFVTNGQMKSSRVLFMGLGKEPPTDVQIRTIAAKSAPIEVVEVVMTATLETTSDSAGSPKSWATGWLITGWNFSASVLGARADGAARWRLR